MATQAFSGRDKLVTLRRGAETFKVYVSQISLNNIRRLFAQIDQNEVWLRDVEHNNAVYFPKEDGNFDIPKTDMPHELIVEGPEYDEGSRRATATALRLPHASGWSDGMTLTTKENEEVKEQLLRDLKEDVAALRSMVSQLV